MLRPSEGYFGSPVAIVWCAALSVASRRTDSSNPATERGILTWRGSSNAYQCAVPVPLGAAGASASFATICKVASAVQHQKPMPVC